MAVPLCALISAAPDLSKLEADAVKKPSPHVLHSLSQALAVPYAELMRLCGYQVPGQWAEGFLVSRGTREVDRRGEHEGGE